MWYFAWILGVALACSLGVINGIWFELRSEDDSEAEGKADTPDKQG